MSMCRVFSCVVGRGCLLRPVRSLGKTLLVFALLYSVLQGQIYLLLQVFPDFLLLQCQASLSITNSRSLLKLMSIKSVMPSNYLILCCSLLLPSISPSIRVSSSESALCIRWPKYWRFSISPSSEYSGLISFRSNWFYLLRVQGTLKSLLQHPDLKASILQHSAFLGSILTSLHDYWKNHSFDYTDFCRQSDVSAF